MTNEGLKDRVIKDLVLLSTVGIRPILVHGGGPEINQWLAKVGIEPVFKKGLRVTDADTMEIVEMVLVGKVNKSLVSLINTAGGRAVGVCGKDGNTLRGKVRDPEWGFVGDVTSVDTSVLQQLVDSGHVPAAPRWRWTRRGRRSTSTRTPPRANSPRPSAPRSSS